MAGCMKN
jgi:hypothetical protein